MWLLYEDEAVNETTGQGIQVKNVLPSWGPDHDRHPDCWCEPYTEWYGDAALVVHNEVH